MFHLRSMINAMPQV